MLCLRKDSREWLDEVDAMRNRYGWAFIDAEPLSEDDEPQVKAARDPDAPQPKKTAKQMQKKELLAHCNALSRKLDRQDEAISLLKKNKDVDTECTECFNEEGFSYRELYHEASEDLKVERNKRGSCELQIKDFLEDIFLMKSDISDLKNQAKIDAVKMNAKIEECKKLEATNGTYLSVLFPQRTSVAAGIAGAYRADSISMMGGARPMTPGAFGGSPPD